MTAAEPILITREAANAISDPLYKAGVEVLLKHGIFKFADSESLQEAE